MDKDSEQQRQVVGGVDTHKDLHVAAVVDEKDIVLATACFATTRQGFRLGPRKGVCRMGGPRRPEILGGRAGTGFAGAPHCGLRLNIRPSPRTGLARIAL